MGNEMHPDLEWLAENVSEWEGDNLFANVMRWRIEENPSLYWSSITEDDHKVNQYTKSQWLQARRDLGLEPVSSKIVGVSESDEEECLQLAYARMSDESVPTTTKQLRYLDAKGDDWIDEFSRTATVDEFRGAMRFTLGKYNRRIGKKDDIPKELDKMIDYCQRWKAYELALEAGDE